MVIITCSNPYDISDLAELSIDISSETLDVVVRVDTFSSRRCRRSSPRLSALRRALRPLQRLELLLVVSEPTKSQLRSVSLDHLSIAAEAPCRRALGTWLGSVQPGVRGNPGLRQRKARR